MTTMYGDDNRDSLTALTQRVLFIVYLFASAFYKPDSFLEEVFFLFCC